jgi:hypothetical protein
MSIVYTPFSTVRRHLNPDFSVCVAYPYQYSQINLSTVTILIEYRYCPSLANRERRFNFSIVGSLARSPGKHIGQRRFISFENLPTAAESEFSPRVV